MNSLINTIEEKGNHFIDKILIPLAKGGKNIFIDNNEIVKSFLTFKTAFMENKISQFVNFLEYESEIKILDFIDSLNQKERIFFIETINKTIDMDDNLQIFILTYLTKSYQKNKMLNYWEKSLFNNIKQISEDDLLLFFDFLETLKEPIKSNDVIYGLPKDIKNEIKIVIKKLENIGILNIKVGGFAEKCINLPPKHNYSVAFSFYPFVNELYIMIKKFKEYENN